MSSPPRVLIAVFSTFERNGWYHPSIGEFLYSLRFNNDYATGFVPVHNFSPAASGRNTIGKFFRDQTEAEWLCMIDNDMQVPANILDTIKDAPKDAGVVTPVFYLWDESARVVKMCLGIEEGEGETVTVNDRLFIKNFSELPTFVKVFKFGTGVTFIRRKTLETVPYPWFKYRYNEDQGMVGTEDIWFCDQAKSLGIPMYGNTKISVGHYHNVNLKVLADLVYSNLVPENVDKRLRNLQNPNENSESPSELEPATASPA